MSQLSRDYALQFFISFIMWTVKLWSCDAAVLILIIYMYLIVPQELSYRQCRHYWKMEKYDGDWPAYLVLYAYLESHRPIQSIS